MPSDVQCPECEGTSIYRSTGVRSRGGYGPSLLPGLGGVFTSATFTVLACKDCGLARYFVDKRGRANLDRSNHWKRVR